VTPWLVDTLKGPSVGSVERSGAAQGLAEVMASLGEAPLRSLLDDMLPLASHPHSGEADDPLSDPSHADAAAFKNSAAAFKNSACLTLPPPPPTGCLVVCVSLLFFIPVGVREGVLWLLNYLPIALAQNGGPSGGHDFSGYLEQDALPVVLQGLSDEQVPVVRRFL
jgi:hypothetical protein